MSIEEGINKIYNQAFSEYGYSRDALFWTKDKQFSRFNILLDESYRKSGLSILDFGCGYADLYDYLVKNNYNIVYNGCDINSNFITKIKETKEKYIRQNGGNIFLINSVKDIVDSYDIILISGSFNLLNLENSAMRDYVFETLTMLFEKTKVMLSVNFLSHLTDEQYKKPGHFYLDPTELYQFVTQTLSPRVIIDTASIPYEITIKVMPDTSINELVLFRN